MANKEHLEWLREGVEAWNKRRELTPFFPDLSDMVTTQNELISVNFSGADLRHAKLNGIDLTNANLSGSELNVAEFKLAILCGANFRNSDVTGAIFDGANVKSHIKSKLYTNLDAHGLTQEQLASTVGDSGTIIPDNLTRPDHWEVLPWHREDDKIYYRAESEIIENALSSPIIRAARIDFSITVDGIVAGTPKNIEIPRRLGTQDCNNRRDALIVLARSAGADVNNRLSEKCKTDLNAYADHLAEYDPINPYVLEDLIAQIAADTADPMVSDGFDERLKTQLSRLGAAHREFMENCAPVAQNALNVINDAPLTRLPTREEVTEVLNRFIAAIEKADAATASVARVMDDLKALNNEINNQVLLATSDAKKASLDATTEKETKNLATIIDRLYWRCREYMNNPSLAVTDGAVIVTLSGKTVPDSVNALIGYLEPIKKTLEQLLTMLPPM